MTSEELQCERARCWVRIKPSGNFAHDMIQVQPDCKTLNVFLNKELAERKGGPNQVNSWSFPTDGILHNVSQEVVYNSVASEMVTSAMKGFNGTLMCYGQTGSGKTYTMTGSCENFRDRGIVPRALRQAFQSARDCTDRCYTFMVSYLEIYNENIYDLLISPCEKQQHQQQPLQQQQQRQPPAHPRSLPILETKLGVIVRGLRMVEVHNEEEAINLFFEGQINRAVASHLLNDSSSRSHCVFTIYIGNYSIYDNVSCYSSSKLNLVDLAGSERIKKTQSVGKVRDEATYINRTLLYLEQVITALVESGRQHVPFRSSRLTLLLKDSLGGGCRTRLVANVRPEARHIEETISTMRFATSLMRVCIRPVVNQKLDKCAYIRCLQDELSRLRTELFLHDRLANRGDISYDPLTSSEKDRVKDVVRQYMEGKTEEIEVVNLVQLKEIFCAFRKLSNESLEALDAAYRNKYIMINRENPELVEKARAIGLIPGPVESETKPDARARDSKVKEATRSKDQERQSKIQAPTDAKTKENRDDALVSKEEGVEEEEEEKEEVGDKFYYPVPLAMVGAPPRSEQFEVFKSTTGCELNRILISNKNMLTSKKKEYSLISREINMTKDQIDRSLQCINALRCARECEGRSHNELGEIIITEAEYLEIGKLKQLKKTYKDKYERMEDVKSEIIYCQNAVDQCRKRLLGEFDYWYFNEYAHLLTASCDDARGRPPPNNFGVNAAASAATTAVGISNGNSGSNQQVGKMAA